jgi:hypothetical protein
MKEASQQAASIYARYGGLTTAASLIATWAVIHAARTNEPATNGGPPCQATNSAACTAPTIRASRT